MEECYIITQNKSNDELYHYGVKGMKWGVIRDSVKNAVGNKYRTYKERSENNKQNKQRIHELNSYSKYGNKNQDKKGKHLERKIESFDDPMARKKRIDADIKEADDRVKFYGSKRAAKAAITDEANYAKKVNNGKAISNTLLYGSLGSAPMGMAMTLATESAASGLFGFATPFVVAGAISASAARKANEYINKHAKDQLLYTDESEYGHDFVIAMKKY